MLSNTRVISAWARALMLFGLLAVWPVHAQEDTVDDLVAEILHDVVDRTIHAAREDVTAHTGVDLLERGYARDARHRSFPPEASGETRRELRQIQREHDREIAMLEDELHRKLQRARAEFKHEAAREDKAEKVMEKRRKLEKKVDTAYAVFNEKVRAVNTRSDEKRERILSKERGRDRGRGKGHGSDEDRARDRGRGPENGHGGDPGHGVDDLKL